jgi:hypothetical protein
MGVAEGDMLVADTGGRRDWQNVNWMSDFISGYSRSCDDWYMNVPEARPVTKESGKDVGVMEQGPAGSPLSQLRKREDKETYI